MSRSFFFINHTQREFCRIDEIPSTIFSCLATVMMKHQWEQTDEIEFDDSKGHRLSFIHKLHYSYLIRVLRYEDEDEREEGTS